MRQIKYRGWDGEEKRMWSWRELQHTHYCASLYSHGDGSWEVMQFTGLLDKNYNEIYEGDVCRVINPNGGEDKQCFVDYDSISACYVYEPENGYGDYDVSSIGWAMQLGFQFEVIGNIYQNSELLEVHA